MVTNLNALSVSRSVQAGQDWHVLAVFERACDLVTPSDDVIALVLPEIGDGPLNIVVDGRPGVFAGVEPGAPATAEGTTLRLSNLEIRLARAAVWEPCPDWERLRRNWKQIESRLPLVRDLALRQAPPDSLLALLSPELGITGFRAPLGRQPVMSDLATQFAGLGGGLTPAGDDFLIGVMLQTWLAHPDPAPLCQTLVEIAAPRTTALSAAFLRAAAKGECNTPWHRLFTTLVDDGQEQLAAATREALSYGYTSGADTLAGFLWTSPHGPQ